MQKVTLTIDGKPREFVAPVTAKACREALETRNKYLRMHKAFLDDEKSPVIVTPEMMDLLVDGLVKIFGAQFTPTQVYDGLEGSPLQINAHMDGLITALGDAVAELPLKAPAEKAEA